MNFFDTKRDELIASIYSENCNEIADIYSQIIQKLDNSDEATESDQKAINQIQLVIRKFLKTFKNNCDVDLKHMYHSLRKRMGRVVRRQITNTQYISYDEWCRKIGLKKKTLKIMMSTVTSFQLSAGCSHFCKRCNEWALPGVRKYFDYNTVKQITTALFDTGNNEFCHYGASDPLDWKHGNRDFSDIVAFMKRSGFCPRYGFLTKVPRGSAAIVDRLVAMDADFAVSITGKNRKKIEKIKENISNKISVQHDLDELLIPAGLDEDFKSIKSSITDNYGTEITPEGAFLIIPTFTSSLNLTGQARIPIHKDSTCFLIRKTGRDALPVEYFKPFEVIDINGRKFFLDKLLDPQIENILLDNGFEEAVPPGMMSLKEYFETFEPEAVKRRKKMIPYVVKELKQKIFNKEEFQGEKSFRIKCFRQKAFAYLQSCRMDDVIECKKNAFSFYLRSIADYLEREPVRGRIVSYLRNNDREEYTHKGNIHGSRTICNIETSLENFGMETYQLFQVLIFRLLENHDDELIKTFVKKRQVVYDVKTDRYITI